VRVGGLVGLLAVEEAGSGVAQGDIEWVKIGDIIWVEVAEVGVELSEWSLGARSRERGFREGVVGSTEVEVDSLTQSNGAGEEGRIEDELLVRTHQDGDDGVGRAVDLGGTLDKSAGWLSGGRGVGSEADEGSSNSDELHFDVGCVKVYGYYFRSRSSL